MSRLVGVALVLGVIVSAATARAHPALDEARERFAAGELAAAVEALDRAQSEGPLTLDELIAVVELRVLAQRALGDEGAADVALRTRAALAPERELGLDVPAVVRDRFAIFARASSGPPRTVVETAPREGGVTLHARIEGDELGLSLGPRLRARFDGGAWSEGTESLDVAAAEGASIEWIAEARGPAGAILSEARGTYVAPTPERGGDAWPWVALGGGVLLVAAVVAISIVAASGVDTRVEGPVIAMLRF